ncbi:MAG: hypothetical protein IPN80_05310 [Flavobacterium sp.]|nr:hypothetical protein [Flavobacterium sp.]
MAVSFSSAPVGSFYVVVRGANSVTTWSASPQIVGAMQLNYDFTTVSTKAYGNNMVEVESGVWAIYSGELSSDDIIDLQDFTFWEGKYLEFAFGVEPSDLNGDGLVDTQDYTIWEGNYLNFVFEARP